MLQRKVILTSLSFIINVKNDLIVVLVAPLGKTTSTFLKQQLTLQQRVKTASKVATSVVDFVLTLIL